MRTLCIVARSTKLMRCSVIESITSWRDPQQFEAVYIVMPTTENVGRIIRDFDGRQQYSGAHLFFIEGALLWTRGAMSTMLINLALPESLFQRLTSSAAEPYLRTLQELFLGGFHRAWCCLIMLATRSRTQQRSKRRRFH